MNENPSLEHDDAALDAVLHMVARIDVSEEAFVAEWERRAALDETYETFPCVSDNVDATSIPLPPPVAPPVAEPLLAPPVAIPLADRPRPAVATREPWRISERGWRVTAIVA